MVASEAGELLTLAETGGLLVACAPDTFLGGAYQAARALIDEGAIGTPLAVAATMLAGGQESWHPDPDIFFKDGAGPLLDMGPYYVYGDRRPSGAGGPRRGVRVHTRGGACDRDRTAGR